jgi:hypothetical protein
MNGYKDMLDNVVSPITCVSMNHQNQLEQMANGTMFATGFLVGYKSGVLVRLHRTSPSRITGAVFFVPCMSTRGVCPTGGGLRQCVSIRKTNLTIDPFAHASQSHTDFCLHL